MSNLAYDAFAGIAAAQAVYSATQDSPYKAQLFDAKSGNSIVIFDLQKTETYKHVSKVTRFPVENGSDISDHQIFEPDQIDLECLLTDTPFNDKALLNSFLNTGAGAVAGPLGVVATTAATTLLGSDDDSNYQLSVRTYKKLRDKYWKARVLVHLQTRMDLFTNMLIENMTVPRDNAISDGLIFNLSLVSINVAEGQQASSSDLATPASSMGNTDIGSQSAIKPVDASKLEKGFTGGVNKVRPAG